MSHARIISRFKGTPVKLIFCGLNYAGKTAMLQRWKTGKFEQDLRTTTSFTYSSNVSLGGGLLKATIYDMGGQKQLRGEWDTMITKTDAVIFVVDANDPQRFPEAKKELHNRVLSKLQNRPCIITANKLDLVCEHNSDKDLMDIINEVHEQVRNALAIPENNQLLLIVTSMVNGLGLDSVIDFLIEKQKSDLN